MKKFTAFLLEGGTSNVPLIVVDIQPAYESYCIHILNNPKFIKLLETQKRILWFFNGEDFGLDSKSAVIDWLYENDISDDIIDKIEFKEKVYGFFRGWMDSGVSDNIILKVIRLLAMNRENDVRDIDIELLQTELGNDFEDIENLIDDGINIPDIAIKELKSYSGGLICGGGKHECLREIELLMSAFNIRYREIKEFIYK